mgnify:CR=1 FL=1
MQEKVLKTLEYDKIAEMLKAKTVTCAGAELAEGMELSLIHISEPTRPY